jgi:hypothetical protein
MTIDATVGGADANSFATLAEFTAYAALRGWTLETTDALNEINMLRAMDALTRKYTSTGYKTTEAQALPYPRVTDVYIDGYVVATDIVPQQWKDAEFEMAYLIQGGADPLATVELGAVKVSKVKAGPVESETEYSGARETPRYVAIEGLIGPFILSGLGAATVKIGRG